MFEIVFITLAGLAAIALTGLGIAAYRARKPLDADAEAYPGGPTEAELYWDIR